MRVNLGAWIGQGWNLLAARWTTWCGMIFILSLPVAVVYGVSEVISFRLQPRNVQSLKEVLTQVMGQSFGISLLTALIVTAISALFYGGLYRAAFKQIRNEEISVGDVFSGVDLYVRVLVTMLIIGALEFVGTLLCFFPALIVRGMLFMALPLVVDRGMEPLDAIKLSFETAKPDWLMWTLVGFVVPILSALGIVACLIGFLFSFGLYFTISVSAYRDIFETAPSVSRLDALYSKECRQCKAMIPLKANFCEHCGAGQV